MSREAKVTKGIWKLRRSCCKRKAASVYSGGGRTSKEAQKLNQFVRVLVIRRSDCPAVKGIEAVFGVEVKEKGIVLALQKLHHATHDMPGHFYGQVGKGRQLFTRDAFLFRESEILTQLRDKIGRRGEGVIFRVYTRER